MKNKRKHTRTKWLADHIWQFTRTKSKSERATLRARMADRFYKASVLIK